MAGGTRPASIISALTKRAEAAEAEVARLRRQLEKPRRRLTDSEINEILDAWHDGASAKKIGSRMDINPYTIRDVIIRSRHKGDPRAAARWEQPWRRGREGET